MRYPEGSVLVVTGYRYRGSGSPVSQQQKEEWPIGLVFSPTPGFDSELWILNARPATEAEEAAWRLTGK